MNELEQLELIARIKEKYPERFEEVFKAHPEWFRQIQDYKREILLVEKAKEDSPEGFYAYFEIKYGTRPPKRIKRWVKKTYDAHSKNLGFTLNGYRLSRKTISFGATFLEFRIGHEPDKTNLVIGAADGTANDIVESVTQNIEFLGVFKKVFPHVTPDKGRWSENGYWVIDTRLTREQWTAQQSITRDPTLVGGGYTSVKINGKHPSGVLLTDDLHGINNSTSERQLKAVVNFYTTELSRTMVYEKGVMKTWAINIGVPWGQDTHQALTRSGAFISETLPVMVKAKESDEGSVYINGVNKQTGAVYDDIIGYWILDEDSNHDVDSIIVARGYGKRDFWQMMMCDMKMANEGGIRYYSFPHEEIDRTWNCVSGVDPSQTFKDKNEPLRENSYLSIANLLKRPMGGGVIEGGILDQCDPNGAVGHFRSVVARFVQHIYFAIEDTGFGQAFKNTISLIAPELVLIFSDLGGIRLKGEKAAKAKDKSTRARTELAPFFENGTILVSDEDTEFLNTLRDGLENLMELDPNKPDKRWDVLDSVYHAVKSMPSVLQQTPIKESLAEVLFKPKKPHPLAGRRK